MNEAAGLEALDAMVADLVGRLQPGDRRKLALRIATDLRASEARSIAANEDAEGKPFVPRKKASRRAGRPQNGRIRQRVKDRMFRRAGTARYLRKVATADEARVGYVGAMARIMRVHQEGLRDTVTRDPGSPEVQYPVREVLGMNGARRLRILETVAGHLGM